MITIMNIRRSYRSPLRQEQVQQTRERILEGLLRALSGSTLQDLSIPAIAREAGVSVPTIYRYFKTKNELVQALALYAVQKVGMELEPLQSPESLIAMIRKTFLAYAGSDELLRASMLSEQSAEISAELFPWRLRIIEDALASAIEPPDLTRLRNIVFLLTTTSSVALCKDVLGLSGEEASEMLAWTIRRLLGTEAFAHEQSTSHQSARSTDDTNQRK
jgi:AcrR family transcriptional regulator